VTIIIDTREQRPFHFDDWPTSAGTLATGDYSIQGIEERVAIERKSLQDLVGCCGRDRERFKRELQRLKAYDCRAVIIEADAGQVVNGAFRGQLKPAHIIGSVASWQTRYSVPFVWAGDHGAAWTLAILRTYHKQLAELVKATGGTTA